MSLQDPKDTMHEQGTEFAGAEPISPDGWDASSDGSQKRTIVVEPNGARRSTAPSPGGEDVRYRLAHVGPLSMLRLSVFFSAGLLVVALAGVAVLYLFLDAIGVLKSIQHLVNTSGLGRHFRFDLGWIVTRLLWIGALMAIAGSLVTTCLAVFYNAVAELGGGLDVAFEPVDRPDHTVRGPRTRGDGRRSDRAGSDRPLQVGVMSDGPPGPATGLPDASGF
jgi:Transmembrane domain of unknown function (DUF3566)